MKNIRRRGETIGEIGGAPGKKAQRKLYGPRIGSAAPHKGETEDVTKQKFPATRDKKREKPRNQTGVAKMTKGA